MVIERGPTEKIGMTIKGGAGGTPGNPNDSADEGVFVSKVCTILTLTVIFFYLVTQSQLSLISIYIEYGSVFACVCVRQLYC